MTNSKPLVTIGITTFNRAQSYLGPALQSALNQTYANLEIIVSDNGSTDGTEEFVKRFRDSRIRYYRHDPALKPNENADFCLVTASGRYFLLLHDDDIIDSDFIETCVAALNGVDAAFARTGARVINGDGKVLKTRENPSLGPDLFTFFNCILKGEAVTYFCNTLYDRECLRSMGGFQSTGFAYHDIITNIKLAHRYGWIDVRDPKASYRIHNSKMGGATTIEKWCEDSLAIVDLMCELLPEHEAYFRREGKKRMCRRNFSKADKSMKGMMKIRAYGIIMKKYRYRHFPFRFVISRCRRGLLGSS